MSGTHDYITETDGCNYSVNLVMADNGPVPDYYDVDQIGGSITFKNSANRAVDEYIGIVITSSDGYSNAHTYRTEYFRVTSECGIEST